MKIVTILFIAIGLSMDAFAVSISSGLNFRNIRINNALKMALFFGFFQALMPVIGWFSGLKLRGFISEIDHWIAFGLLSFIGFKMIYDSIRYKSTAKEIKCLSFPVLTGLSIATSIDAFAVGISFAFLKVFIITPVLIIGVITFLLSFIGIFIGNKIGNIFGKKIEITGGIILIAIGIKILIEHF